MAYDMMMPSEQAYLISYMLLMHTNAETHFILYVVFLFDLKESP